VGLPPSTSDEEKSELMKKKEKWGGQSGLLGGFTGRPAIGWGNSNSGETVKVEKNLPPKKMLKPRKKNKKGRGVVRPGKIGSN